MANEDLRFQMGMDVQVDSVEQAKIKLKELNEEMAKLTSGVKLNVNEQDIEKTKNQISALERSIQEVERSGGTFGNVFEKNLKEITSETKKATVQMSNLDREARQLGTNGAKGFQSVSKAARLATSDIRGTQTQMDKLRTNMEQGLGQTLAFGAIGAVSGGFISALNVARDLDKVSTDISIVSGQTAGEMEKYRDAAVEASDALGTTTQRYLEASLIYKQQGGEAAYYARELAESTVVAANISGVATDQMSEYLTSTINGFELLAEKGGEAGTYVTDVLAQLGAASGSDLAEVATGLTRVAATAKEAGYEFEEISAMIATVSERTRRTPETIGNAFKSILANFNQIKEAGDDAANEFTSKVEAAFESANLDISMFDNGELRDAADIFKDIAANWGTMTKEQRALIATNVAGKYQMENFIAFMESQERYEDLLAGAYEAAGTSANQQLIYMDSFQAKIDGLKNAWQGAANTIVDSDMFKGALEDLTNMLKIVGNMESGFGGLAVAAAPLIGIGTNMFGAPKIKESYINRNINSGLIDDKDIENSIRSLELEESATKRLIEEKKRERDIVKETGEITRQLGPEAAARYQEMADEAAVLASRLELVRDKEEERLELGKQIAEQIKAGQGPKGFNQAAMVAKADEIRDNPEVAAEEKSTVKRTQEQIAAQESNLQYYGRISKEMNQISADTSTNVDRMAAWQVTASNIADVSQHITKEEKAQLEAFVAKIDSLDLETDLTRENLTKNKELRDELKEIEAIHNKVVEAQKEETKETQKALKVAEKKQEIAINGVAAADQLAEINDQAVGDRADKKQLDQSGENLKKLGRSGEALEKSIRGVATAYQAVVPLIATYKAAQDGTLSTQDAVITGTQSISMALLSSMNPWGMAAGVVVGAMGLVVDHFDLFKDRGEKAKEANEELIKSFLSLQEQVSGNMQNLSGIEETYRAFEGLDVEGFLNNKPDPSDTDALEEYNEQLKAYDDMANKIASTNPELVKGYDDTGRVILDLTKSFEQLMKVQEEAAVNNYVMMNENSASFVAQQVWELDEATDKLNKYSKQIREAKNDLEDAKKAGDEGAIGDALKGLSESQNNLGKARESFTAVKGSIQTNLITPFNEANLAFNELVEKAPELKSVFSSFSNTYMNTDLISNLASLGEEDTINNLMENMENIRNKYVELGNTDPQAAIQFMEDFSQASEWTKLSLYDTYDTFEDLQKAMQNLVDPVQNSYSRVSGLADAFLSQEDVEKVKVRISELSQASKDAREEVTQYSKAADSGFNPASRTEINANNEEIDSLNKKIDAYNDLQSKLSEVSSQYEKTSRTIEGFNENVDRVTGLEKTKDLLEEIGDAGIDSSAFEELKNLAPDISSALQKAAKEGPEAFGKASKNMFQGLKEEQDAAVLGMMMNNEDYYTEWKKLNKETVDLAAENYGIDASNYANLTQFKTALEELSIEDLRILAGARVEVGKGADDAEVGNTANKLTNMTTMNDIFKNDSLSIFEKLHVGILNVIDNISNGWNNMLESMFSNLANFLNEAQKGLGAMGDVQLKKMGISDTKLNDWFTNLGSGGAGFKASNKKSSTRADDQMAEYAEANRKQALADSQERSSLIQQILNAQQNGGSATDIANRLNLLGKKDAASTKLRPGALGQETDNGSGVGDKGDDGSSEKEVANLDLTLDRYYKLENLLKRVQERYDELSQAKDAAYGQDKLNIMQQEQQLLQERAGILNRYSKELEQEQAELRNKLVSNGFSFDINGDVANLNQRLTAMQNAANSLAGEAKEEAIENVKKIQEEAKRYTDITFNLIPDKKKALNEIKKQLSDIARETIEYQIKLQVDKNDLKRQVIDAVKELNDGFANTDERLQLTGQSLKLALDEVDFYQNKINEIKGNSGLTDAAREELLQDANKSLLSAVQAAQSAYKDLGAIQAEYVKELQEAFGLINERYDNIIDKSQTMIDKTEELYGSRGYGKVLEYYKVQEEALNDQLGFLIEAQKELIRYRDTLKQGTDAWKDANDAVNEMGENIESNLLKKLESVKKQFDAFTANLASQFENMFGAWGFQGAQDDFDKLIEKQDKYFNSFEKLSTIGQRIKGLNDEIAKTSDPKRAAELTALRDREYETLLKADKVSQADYDRAEKLYQIKLKEMALEERQNAQRIAQLVRDENGNMTYEYVRKESEDLQSELDELQKQKDDLYAFDSDQVRESAKGVFDVIAQYQQQIQELQNKGLSEEDYKKELEKLLNGAEKDIKEKTDEMNKWLANAGKDGIDSLQNMINKGVVDPESLGLNPDTLQSIFSAMNDGSLGIQDMLSGDYGDFASSIGMTSDQLKAQMDTLLQVILGDNFDIAQAMMDASNKWTSTAQDNVNALGNAYAQYMTHADQVLQQYNNSTGTLNNLLNQTNQAANQVINTTKTQTNVMIQAQQQTDKYSSSVNNLTNRLVGANGLYSGMVQITRTMNENLRPSMVATGATTDVLSSKTNFSADKYRLMAKEATGAYSRVNAFRDEPTKRAMDRIDDITSRSNRSAGAFRSISTDASKARQSILDFSGAVQNLKSYGAYKLDTGGLVSGATGMYTGTWNNSANNAEGRLALLHQKEIVLNQEDTGNLLEAVHMQRDLLKSIEGRGGTSDRMAERLSNNISNVQTTNNNRSVLQPITIQADFPAVKQSHEIESAFEGLFTKASTYVGKNN